MAEVTIQENTWQELVEVARRRRKKPEQLTDDILREFLQRQADEELLKQSNLTAQESPFPASATEEIVKQFRRRKKQG